MLRADNIQNIRFEEKIGHNSCTLFGHGHIFCPSRYGLFENMLFLNKFLQKITHNVRGKHYH